MTTPDKTLIVSIHDVTPACVDEVKEAMSLLRGLGVSKLSLLAVPEYHGTRLDAEADFIGWLRECRDAGDEIILHGYKHLEQSKPRGLSRKIRNALFTRGEGEFLGAAASQAGEWLDAGLEMLRNCGFEPEGFVAPAWLLEQTLLPELTRRGILYTTLRSRILDLRARRAIPAPTVVLRGSSRNMSRLSRSYFNLMLLIWKWRPVVRLAIHPVDIRHGAQAWIRTIIEGPLASRRTTSYIDFIREMSAG